jgi:cellulose biosynthesis protein BcsQ
MTKVVAVYNMKGGVGKTTTAVNLSHLAASRGLRVLLWDLDPQAAATFAFRIRPRVDGFDKKSLRNGKALGEAIKETDYPNLDLLPADFAYRKLDRFLDDLGKPKRTIASLIETIGEAYDLVVLDCPAGFSLVTESLLAAADFVLVPTIPTVLSLRTVDRLLKWADRSSSRAKIGAFFSMVDRRKTLHRRACEWSREYPEVFLAAQVPYASVVEQMTVRRQPLVMFAAREAATAAFMEIWQELEARLAEKDDATADEPDRWKHRRQAVDTLLARLESTDGHEPAAHHLAPVIDMQGRGWTRDASRVDEAGRSAGASVVHRFDTDNGDLRRRGRALELHERKGGWTLVVATAGADNDADTASRAQVQIDRSWAFDILSGTMSPLVALERRLGRPGPALLEQVRTIIGDHALLRIDSRLAERAPADRLGDARADADSLPSTIREAV